MFLRTGYFGRKVQRNRLDGMKMVHATLLHILCIYFTIPLHKSVLFVVTKKIFAALFQTSTTEAISGRFCLVTSFILYPYMVPIRYLLSDFVLFPASTRPEGKCNRRPRFIFE